MHNRILAKIALNGQDFSVGFLHSSTVLQCTTQSPQPALLIHPVDRPHAPPPRFRAVCGFTGALLSPELFGWEAQHLAQSFKSWDSPIDPVTWGRAAAFICDRAEVTA